MVTPKPTSQFKIRFSLRTLLIITAISGLFCGWLGIQYSNCQRESNVLARLIDEGALVTSVPKSDRFFDTQFVGRFSRAAHQISLGKSDLEHSDFMELVGQLKHVRALQVRPDSDLQGLEPLLELRDLELTGWTCDSLKGIENCKQLETFYLYDGDHIETLEPLRGMINLKLVWQSLEDSTQLNVEADVVATWANLREFEILACEKIDLAGFADLQFLEILDISHADEVTGFEALKNMSSLRRLALPECASLEDLDFCRQMSGLEELVLYKCKSLKSIDGISQLKKLEKVWLTDCLQLKDLSAFEHIKSLRKLTLKKLYRNENTEEQIESLKQALPKTQISVR